MKDEWMMSKYVVCFLLGVLFFPLYLCAEEGSRRRDEDVRNYLASTEHGILEGAGRLLVDYGALLTARYDEYHDSDNDRSLRDVNDFTESLDTRVWMRAVLKPPLDADYENEHSLYVRVKDLLVQRRPDDAAGGSDHDGPHVDYAYLTCDFRPVMVEIGRTYFSVGDGIAYSNVHDGVSCQYSSTDWQMKVFASHSIPREDNIDTSVPGYDEGTDRYFYGAECRYYGLWPHAFYSYALMQKDYSDEEPEDPTHNYNYDSQYIGMGVRGAFFDKVQYAAEIIREWGKSYIYASNERKDIDAWAATASVSYGWDIYSHPTLSCRYGFGSGDSDRANVTDTVSGNAYGDDENFLPFGYYNTGYVISPALSNLHFYSVSVKCTPLERISFLRQAELDCAYYRFYKDASLGGVSDAEASAESHDVGHEIDVGVRFPILSDVSALFEWGIFFPGDAYLASADDVERYFSFSVDISI